MHRTWLFISLVLLLPTGVLSQTAQRNINTLHGKVRSTNGVSINNAIVELWQYGALLHQTVTRTEGDFYFTSLAPTEYEVVVNASGYEPARQGARFMGATRSNVGDILNIEVLVRPKVDPLQPPAGVNFVQEVPKAARLAYEAGVEKLRDGKADEGLAGLRQAVEIFSDYFAANFALARELFVRGKHDEAIQAIERARLVNDREAAVYHLFGLIMFKQGKFAAADYGFRGAINLQAGFIAAHLFRGRALIELALLSKEEKPRVEYFAEAEKALTKAWELSDKRLSEVYLHRARIHENRGNKDAAAKALEAYLKAEPRAANAAQIKLAIDNLRKK